MTHLRLTRTIPFLLLGGMVAEIASIIWVGRAFGVIPTVLLLLAGGVIGIKLLKSAGTSIMEAFRSPVQPPSPARGVEGLAVTRVLAGLLFLIPGFFSDVFALLVLLPPVQGWVGRRFRVKTFSNTGERSAEPFGGSRPGAIIEGEAIEIRAEIEPPPPADKQTG